MASFKVPFTLEQEKRYRDYIAELFLEPNAAEYRHEAGVLTNMIICNMASSTIEDGDLTAFDDHPDAIKHIYADFSFLSCHASLWLHDEEFEEARAEVERREKLITGKVSNSIDDDIYQLKPSSVIHKEGLDPDRELTSEEWQQAIEEQMQGFADNYDLDVDDFKQMVGERIASNCRRNPKGFGKKINQNKSNKSKSQKRKRFNI